jgi:hypothetical protein
MPYLHLMCQDGYKAETALLQTLTRHTVTSACTNAQEITSLAECECMGHLFACMLIVVLTQMNIHVAATCHTGFDKDTNALYF